VTRQDVLRIADAHRIEPADGMPDGVPVVAPPDLDAGAEVLRAASASATPVVFWGAGSHQGYGHRVDAELVISTARLDRIVDWQPDDLTVVVEAGVPVRQLEEHIGVRQQSAVLAEQPGRATVGGTIATGLSGFRRLRYGPVRDRVLESVVVTGDGRITTAGGRVVKNVTGYDIPRLVTGSLGSLGLLGRVCLKLWPEPAAVAALPVGDPVTAARIAYRPLAVLETNDAATVIVGGTEEEIAGQATDLGTSPDLDVRWPELPDAPWQVVLRVPPARTADAVARLRAVDGASFIAAHGVGEVQVAATSGAAAGFGELRHWAESIGGVLVVAARPGPDALFDPWGTPPATLDLQRQVKAAFDPAGIANPGRLPGRI
jgi:glycolate oxidase FAD binding subunit